MPNRRLNQDGEDYPVHCCICTQAVKPVPATSLVCGYALCDEHAELTHREFARVIQTYIDFDEDEADEPLSASVSGS